VINSIIERSQRSLIMFFLLYVNSILLLLFPSGATSLEPYISSLSLYLSFNLKL
jgi:hypothetical protein